MDEITAAAQAGTGTFYRHFPSKAAAFQHTAPTRAEFERALGNAILIISKSLPSRDGPERRRQAIAYLALIFGTVNISNAVNAPGFAGEIQEAAKQAVAFL